MELVQINGFDPRSANTDTILKALKPKPSNICSSLSGGFGFGALVYFVYLY
ncbi:hypothetical protein [Cysteiniphilum litorale]|uniref:hypothetical protein n=1 Tax=Cysteiniphilum litorale TaxID=2056700 RepID=UPI003F881B20